MPTETLTRRRLLRSILVAPLVGAPLLGACSSARSSRHHGPPAGEATSVADAAVVAERERSCTLTEDNIEGPFFLPGAPHRAVLVTPEDTGARLALSGRVLSTRCAPIAGARIELWQADAAGRYDVDGFRFRGQLVTNADGSWEVATILPGRYLNGAQYRPAHIHVKLEHPRFRPLTTQLYFEGDPFNGVDPWVKESLVLRLADRRGGGKASSFDFVLDQV